MRSLLHFCAVAGVVLLACSSDSDSAPGATRYPIVSSEFSFPTPLGAPVASDWQLAGRGTLTCFGLLPDGAAVSMTGDQPAALAKIDSSGNTLWKTTLADAGANPLSGFDLTACRDHAGGLAVTSEGNTLIVSTARILAPGTSEAHRLRAALVDSTGKLVWQKDVDPRNVNISGVGVVADGAGGVIASAALVDTTPGSIADPQSSLYRISKDGTVQATAPITPLHVPEYDHPSQRATQSTMVLPPPGTPTAAITGLTAARDGGVFLSGTYLFDRTIECGSESAPKDVGADGSPCKQYGSEFMVRRFDASLKEVWSKHYGDGFLTSITAASVAELGNGNLIATGYVIYNGSAYNPPSEAYAMGLGPDGSVRWVTSHPWGKAPGARFFEGITSFGQAAWVTNDAAEIVLIPPSSSPCELVRIRDDGSIVRTQILNETQPSGGAPGRCTAVFTPAGALVTGETTLFHFPPFP